MGDDELVKTRHDDGAPRLLARALRGERAVAALEPLLDRAAPRLELDARPLERVDSFGGSVVREVVERHLGADPGHTVVLREPHNLETLAMLHDLVGPLPRRARWAGDVPPPRRERLVLLPATRVADISTAGLLGDWLTVVAGAVRLPASEARLLETAAVAFSANALGHGRPEASLLLCACLEPQGNDLQLVALSEGVPRAANEHPIAYITDVVERSRSAFGSLFSLVELARRREIDVTLRIATGVARLRWRDGEPTFNDAAAYVPAFVASLEVHLPG